MAKQKASVVISAPKFQTIILPIRSTAPLLQCKFSHKAKQAMMQKMADGPTARSKKKREARDYDEDFEQAQHKSEDGWNGIPAAAFRNAAIRACTLVGFKMTQAKMSIFIEADGYSWDEGIPLVRIQALPPERNEMIVRIQQTTDIRVRPMWREWKAVLKIRFDADQFTAEDVYNLMMRAGMQVGVGEGRPSSKSSTGMGFGTFEIDQEAYNG